MGEDTVPETGGQHVNGLAAAEATNGVEDTPLKTKDEAFPTSPEDNEAEIVENGALPPNNSGKTLEMCWLK